MLKRWILYLAALTGCLIYLFYDKGWVAWIIFVSMALLPALSLVLSLPAMLTARLHSSLPRSVTMGSELRLEAEIRSLFPLPRQRFRVQVENILTGERKILDRDQKCPTGHCGALELHFFKCRVQDYLGLFCLPLKTPGTSRVLVMPDIVEPAVIPDTTQLTGNAWRPKPGGGFAENSELRSYHPGDNLRQIHWKLSAKTGDLILREPMIPVEFNLLLWLCHCGTPELLDRKLGNLIWLSNHLLRGGLPHDVMAFTADDYHVWHIERPEDVTRAVEALLCIRPSEPMHEIIPPEHYHWQYCIGGDEGED